MLLQVAVAVEAGGAEVAGERALPGVDDDMPGELRATLLVLAADVADETLRQARPIGVDDLSVPLQVAEAAEAAAAEVAGEGPGVAVDGGVARQQRPKLEHLAADGAREHPLRGGGAPPAAGAGVARPDPQVHADLVLFEAGGALEAAQADAAAVRLVTCVDAGMSSEQRLRFEPFPTHAAGKRGVRWAVFAIDVVAVDQDFVAFELVLASELAAADVAEVRPLTCVRLEVDGELRPALKLFAAEVAEQRARPRGLGGAVHVHDLLVVLKVVGPHVGLGAKVAAVRLHPRVDDLVRLEPRAAAERLAADGTQPRLNLPLFLPLGDAVWMQPIQVVLQVVAAIEAQFTQVAGERLLPRVDEGVASQTRLVLHHFAANVAHGAVELQLHRGHILGVRPQGSGRRGQRNTCRDTRGVKPTSD